MPTNLFWQLPNEVTDKLHLLEEQANNNEPKILMKNQVPVKVEYSCCTAHNNEASWPWGQSGRVESVPPWWLGCSTTDLTMLKRLVKLTRLVRLTRWLGCSKTDLWSPRRRRTPRSGSLSRSSGGWQEGGVVILCQLADCVLLVVVIQLVDNIVGCLVGCGLLVVVIQLPDLGGYLSNLPSLQPVLPAVIKALIIVSTKLPLYMAVGRWGGKVMKDLGGL